MTFLARQTELLGNAADIATPGLRSLKDLALNDPDLLTDLEGDGSVGEFELGLAQALGCSFALALSSGTVALQTALLAADVGPGDEVIVSPYGWGQTVAAVLAVGATPRFADIELERGTLDPIAVKECVNKRTRCVLVTHMHGCPADMEGLRRICLEGGLTLIADAAQAMGARLHGLPIAHWADITCFSFGRGKLITTGEGGAFLTDDADYFERAMLLSQHPLRSLRQVEDPQLRLAVSEFFLSFRLAPVLAEIGRVQVPLIQNRLQKAHDDKAKIDQRLSGLPMLRKPTYPKETEPTFYRYVARWLGAQKERDEFAAKCTDLGLSACWAGPNKLPLHLWLPSLVRGSCWLPRAFRLPADGLTNLEDHCPNATRRVVNQDLVITLKSA